jgi:enoyl-CoA hydratase/carnithine racemase
MKFDTILVDDADGVGIITLNRPSALNAINGKMMDELGVALSDLGADPEIRVVVVTGAGRAFSAGRDMKEIGHSSHRSASDLWSQIEELGKPVIAAVNGLCYTGAFSMLLCFDLVVASDAAVFADTHAKFGMYHGGGTTQRLRNAVGALKAKEILFSCQPIDAAEALRLGLVNRVVPGEQLAEEVATLARMIARNDPNAIRVTKMLINQGTRWGSAVGFDLEAREYRRQRQAVADGTAKIEVSSDGGERQDV